MENYNKWIRYKTKHSIRFFFNLILKLDQQQKNRSAEKTTFLMLSNAFFMMVENLLIMLLKVE